MFIEIATATEMQNNFGKYLSLVLAGKEVIVTKNGKEVGRFVPKDAAVSYHVADLIQKGVLKEEYNLDDVKSERLREKYETLD